MGKLAPRISRTTTNGLKSRQRMLSAPTVLSERYLYGKRETVGSWIMFGLQQTETRVAQRGLDKLFRVRLVHGNRTIFLCCLHIYFVVSANTRDVSLEGASGSHFVSAPTSLPRKSVTACRHWMAQRIVASSSISTKPSTCNRMVTPHIQKDDTSYKQSVGRVKEK